MNRTISTSAEVDAALEFLGKQSTPPVSGTDYFTNKIELITKDALTLADSNRFELINKALDGKDKSESLNKIREILGI